MSAAMIDEKRLDRWEEFVQMGIPLMLSETQELLRLARLGLWASSIGIPALKDIENMGGDGADFGVWRNCAEAALAALPKEGGNG